MLPLPAAARADPASRGRPVPLEEPETAAAIRTGLAGAPSTAGVAVEEPGVVTGAEEAEVVTEAEEEPDPTAALSAAGGCWGGCRLPDMLSPDCLSRHDGQSDDVSSTHHFPSARTAVGGGVEGNE